MLRGLRLAVLAAGFMACGAICGAASAQPEPPRWPNQDPSGRPAPMTFGVFHTAQTYDRAVERLLAAGCKREDLETFTRFDCEAAPNQWYLTKPGRLEHPALAVTASPEPGVRPEIMHTIPLLKSSDATPEKPSIEQREAFALWRESLPFKMPTPAPRPPRQIDWDALLKEAPLNNARMQDPNLTFEAARTALEAARDCTRTATADSATFDCATSRTRWHITPDGSPAYPGLVLMYPETKLFDGGDDAKFVLGPMKFFPSPSADAAARTAHVEAVRAWIERLPERRTMFRRPIRSYSLLGSPLSDDDFEKLDLTYEGMLQKLTDAGCTRKETGEYIAFSCKGTSLIFVLSTPSAEAHPVRAIAEPDPSGKEMRVWLTSRFRRTTPGTNSDYRTLERWSRHLSYLPPEQLR